MSETPQQAPLNDEEQRQQTEEEIVALYDVSARFRKYVGPFAVVVAAIAIIWSLFQLYTAGFGVLEAVQQRSIHVGFALVLIFLLFPFRSQAGVSKPVARPSIMDIVLAVLAFVVVAYLVLNFREIARTMGSPSQTSLIMGSICILLVLEAARRVVGPVLPGIALVFLLYAYFGGEIPGFFGHRGYSFQRIVSHMYLTTEGIFGVAAGVSATFVFLFILFGAFLGKTGTGRLFIDLALALMGHQPGGPAKVAVVASGLMGTINGSSVANVAGTGTFTIPLMKSIGYKPHFAGAVEAAASTGGQLMPPVMGAGAFLMAEITGIPYSQIIIAAIVPAFLYYLGVFVSVHLEAKRTGLVGLPKDRLPNAARILRQRGHLVIPIIVLLYVLMNGYTPTFAALTGIISSVVVSMFSKETRLSLRDILDTLHDGARQALSVAIACAVVGFVIGVTTLTGFGLKLATGVVALAGGNVILTCVFTMFASLILGMGLPTTANYLVTSTIAAPALLQLGVATLSAHMFVYYFGIIADLTPPVALAAMTGAGIAQANPTRTGLTSFRIAAAGYLVPYVFVLAPALLILNSDPLDVLHVGITATTGVLALAAALTGYFSTHLNLPQRALLAAGALALIEPGLTTAIVGVVLVVGIYLWQRRQAGSRAQAAVVAESVKAEVPSASERPPAP